MNNLSGGIAAQKQAYDNAQRVIGAPAVETLQVEESLLSMGEVVEFHAETVRALLRRLQPVTSVLCETDCTAANPQPVRVEVARRISNRRDELYELTTEVQNVIRALQI